MSDCFNYHASIGYPEYNLQMVRSMSKTRSFMRTGTKTFDGQPYEAPRERNARYRIKLKKENASLWFVLRN